MQTITKKAFMELHKSKLIHGIAAPTMPKEKACQIIAEGLLKGHELPTFPLSRVDLNKYDTVYKDNDFIFVETIEPGYPTRLIIYRVNQ